MASRKRRQSKIDTTNKNLRRTVLGRDGHRCYWCLVKIIDVGDIPVHKRIKQKAWIIVWRGGKKVKDDYYATLDHIRPWWRGGSQKADNLVAACGPCNNARGGFLDPNVDRLDRRTAARLWGRKIKSRRIAALAEETRRKVEGLPGQAVLRTLRPYHERSHGGYCA